MKTQQRGSFRAISKPELQKGKSVQYAEFVLPAILDENQAILREQMIYPVRIFDGKISRINLSQYAGREVMATLYIQSRPVVKKEKKWRELYIVVNRVDEIKA